MASSHVLVLPFPAQGHVNPLMLFSRKLVKHGFKITFVNTDIVHKRVVGALDSLMDSKINMVSIPDGLGPEDDRNEIGKLLADAGMGWALEAANKMGIKGVIYWSPSTASLALQLSIPRLIDDGIINCEGLPTQRQMIQLFPGMPAMDTAYIPWNCIGDPTCQKIFFQYTLRYMQAFKFADWWLCNTVHELDNHPAQSCMLPLVALQFLIPTQFQELAIGLELTNRPFLWVVRPDILNGSKTAYTKEFQGTRGKIVGWAPQTKVLNHPAIACFISHCGWNSTVEGLSNGVPFLCWPYFADQFLDRSYICDVWKVGLGFEQDENGIILREEIKRQVDQLLGDANIRARSLELKKMLMNNVAENGQSSKNFNNFIQWLKE
uniref:Glycosyltransferase N-terminal domain-containing protein n=1 Tax=Fagus sylvatica TaxID=28930 RepID=A0A2N9FGH8_FAGSY